MSCSHVSTLVTATVLPNNRQSGFTLIEVMVVIVILGVLGMIVVPNVFGKLSSAKVDTTKITLKTVSGSLDEYYLNNGKYPSTQEGLQALITPVQGTKNFPDGGYIKGGKIPTDGWENDLQYVSPGQEGRKYDLFSLGADGKEGGEGQDADIFAKL